MTPGGYAHSSEKMNAEQSLGRACDTSVHVPLPRASKVTESKHINLLGHIAVDISGQLSALPR